MSDQLAIRVKELVGDAQQAFDRDDWATARSFARAALALDASDIAATRLLSQIDQVAPVAGERRQLTVMFCDIVGSTQLTGRLDPETVHGVLRSYQAVCDEAIRRYGGVIANYIGDGVLAYFGHPTPHEDDPLRAVKAGLELLAGARDLVATTRQRHGAEIDVRVAVHTGLVVRADMGTAASPDRDAIVGETPNIAARLQDAARPGTLVISRATHDLVSRQVTVTPLGPLDLRGVLEPIEAFEVVAALEATGRFGAQQHLTPFVGRSEEVRALAGAWDSVVDGGSAAVVLRGEPGIGKSRLADTVRQHVLAEGRSAVMCACSIYHTTTHLYAVRRLVEGVAGIDTSRDADVSLATLRSVLARTGQEESLPVLAALLDLPSRPWCPPVELEGTRLRDVTLAALLDWMAAAAAESPRLLIFDDLQWADPSTMDLLTAAVIRKIPRLMLLLTARDQTPIPWATTSVTVIDLDRLGPEDATRLAGSLPQADRIPRGHLSAMVEQSDGIPLYLEELIRSRSAPPERFTGRNGDDSQPVVPAALRDQLLARFAAPGVDLDLAQTIATVGHEVAHDVLCEVTGLAELDLSRRMAPLIDANLLEVHGDPPTYRFHHRLLGRLAYDTQLLPERRERHSRIADVLAARRDGGVPTDAGAAGYHLERAGRTEEAIEEYVRAARVTQSHGAHAEATAGLTHALGLLDRVTDERRRLLLELSVRDARGFSATATLGYAAPGAAEDYERCRQIIGHVDVGPTEMGSLYGVFSYYLLHGDLDRAEEVLMTEPSTAGRAVDEIPEELGWGMTRFFRGDYRGAISDMGVARASPFATGNRPLPPDWPVPNDPLAGLWSIYAVVLVITCEPDGIEEVEAALARAEARSADLPFPYGPFTRAFAKSFAFFVYYLLGDIDRSLAANAVEVAIGEAHGFTFFGVLGNLQRAMVDADRGVPGAQDHLTGALAMWRMLGAELWVPVFLTESGRAALGGGEPARALELAEEAFAVAERTGNTGWWAETQRLVGEARLAAGDPGGLDDLRAAVETAVGQGARLFELRARTSLHRATGDADARAALADLVGSFPSAVELRDLALARAALDEPSIRR